MIYGIVRGNLVHETHNALLVNDGTKEDWIPRSVCKHISKSGNGEVKVIVEVWLLAKKGFDYEEED